MLLYTNIYFPRLLGLFCYNDKVSDGFCIARYLWCTFLWFSQFIVYCYQIHLTGGVAIPALWDTAMAEKKFPVIVFSHGLSANRSIYSTVCSELASHGFVVAAVEHRLAVLKILLCWTI